MCGKSNETVMHILSECEKLAQLEYKKRHGRAATIIHWEFYKHHDFPHCKNWYDHRAEPVLEKDNTKIVIVDKKKKRHRLLTSLYPETSE